jgi:biopolymer transport protein TolR
MGMAAGAKGGTKRRRRGRRSGAINEINMTPFIDVVLVLLIVFMVAAPMMTVGSEASKSGFEERVFVRGDKRVDYGRVAQVMAIVTGGGFKKVALVTEPEQK